MAGAKAHRPCGRQVSPQDPPRTETASPGAAPNNWAPAVCAAHSNAITADLRPTTAPSVDRARRVRKVWLTSLGPAHSRAHENGDTNEATKTLVVRRNDVSGARSG